MRIHFEIKKNSQASLALFEGGEKKGNIIEWKEDNSLSRFFLKKIEEILKRNKTSLDKISGYKIISHIPKNWTSVRIAKITLESLMTARLAK